MIMCLVAGACFVLGAFAMWLFLRRRRRGWRECRRCRSKRRRRDRRKLREEAGDRVWFGMEKGAWGKGSEERSGERMRGGRESAVEEGVEDEVRAEECLGGIY